MNSQQIMQAFREERPVRFGDIVFSRIDSVTYRRVMFNHYIESAATERVTPRHECGVEKLNIIQAVCMDSVGRQYVLNPRRLEEAVPGEVNTTSEVDHILTERLKLMPIFEAWCEEHGLDVTIDALLAFLFVEDLINAGKAYHAVEAYEQVKIREEEEI